MTIVFMRPINILLLLLLNRAHRAVIFAVAQLSCFNNVISLSVLGKASNELSAFSSVSYGKILSIPTLMYASEIWNRPMTS